MRIDGCDGSKAILRGEFSAFVRSESLDMSILGRDILDHFTLIADLCWFLLFLDFRFSSPIKLRGAATGPCVRQGNQAAPARDAGGEGQDRACAPLAGFVLSGSGR